MNCLKHPKERMTLLFNSYVCDVCEPPKGKMAAKPIGRNPMADIDIDPIFLSNGQPLRMKLQTNKQLNPNLYGQLGQAIPAFPGTAPYPGVKYTKAPYAWQSAAVSGLTEPNWSSEIAAIHPGVLWTASKQLTRIVVPDDHTDMLDFVRTCDLIIEAQHLIGGTAFISSYEVIIWKNRNGPNGRGFVIDKLTYDLLMKHSDQDQSKTSHLTGIFQSSAGVYSILGFVAR